MPCPYNDKASPRKNKGVLIKESAFLLNTGAIRRRGHRAHHKEDKWVIYWDS